MENENASVVKPFAAALRAAVGPTTGQEFTAHRATTALKRDAHMPRPETIATDQKLQRA